MSRRRPPLDAIRLRGLRVAPPQSWGQIRLVPLIRERVRPDLRLWSRPYDEPFTMVGLGGEPELRGEKYFAFIPHGLVVRWTEDGEAVGSVGGELTERRAGSGLKVWANGLGVRHRLVRRESKDTLRMLPLHLAMEGFLALHYRGPDTTWSDWSRQALSHGLSPRSERVLGARAITGLEEALGHFEIHEGQCGVVLYVADALGSAFVVPHPDDYRALHRTLLLDFYGETLYHYGRLPGRLPDLRQPLGQEGASLADLRGVLARARADWADIHANLAQGLLDREIQSERVYSAGPFQLERFLTRLAPAEENHIGEAIHREDGELQYLKTFRLSAAQVTRALMLERCAAHGWRLEQVAETLHISKDELVRRMCRMGFDPLIRRETIRKAYGDQIPGWVRPG